MSCPNEEKCHYIKCNQCTVQQQQEEVIFLSQKFEFDYCKQCQQVLCNDKQRNYEFQSDLENLIIKCPTILNSPQLCKVQLPYKDIFNHLKICEYRNIQCKYRSKGCQKQGFINKIQNHELLCQFQIPGSNYNQIIHECQQEQQISISKDNNTQNKDSQQIQYQKDKESQIKDQINKELNKSLMQIKENNDEPNKLLGKQNNEDFSIKKQKSSQIQQSEEEKQNQNSQQQSNQINVQSIIQKQQSQLINKQEKEKEQNNQLNKKYNQFSEFETLRPLENAKSIQEKQEKIVNSKEAALINQNIQQQQYLKREEKDYLEQSQQKDLKMIQDEKEKQQIQDIKSSSKILNSTSLIKNYNNKYEEEEQKQNKSEEKQIEQNNSQIVEKKTCSKCKKIFDQNNQEENQQNHTIMGCIEYLKNRLAETNETKEQLSKNVKDLKDDIYVIKVLMNDIKQNKGLISKFNEMRSSNIKQKEQQNQNERAEIEQKVQFLYKKYPNFKYQIIEDFVKNNQQMSIDEIQQFFKWEIDGN